MGNNPCKPAEQDENREKGLRRSQAGNHAPIRDMKLVLLVLAGGLFSALTAMATDSSNSPAQPVTAGQQFQTAYLPTPYPINPPAAADSGKWKATRIFSRIKGAFKSIGHATAEEVRSDIIVRYGKDSSRAWTSIACCQPNETVYGDCSVHEPSFGVGIH